MRSKRGILIYFLFPILVSCHNPKQLSWSQYSAWLNDHGEFIIRESRYEDIKFTVRYIPADVSAYRDFQSLNQYAGTLEFDSLVNLYECGLRFQLSIESDIETKNLLYFNSKDDGDYKLRVETLSFYPEEFISIVANENIQYPVLSQFEGYSELTNKIVVHLVFDPSWYQCKSFAPMAHSFSLVFNDPFWDTGISRFEFDAEQLEAIPNLTI